MDTNINVHGDPFADDIFTDSLPPLTPATTATTKRPTPELLEQAALLFIALPDGAGWTCGSGSDTEAIYLLRSPEGESRLVFLADEPERTFCSCPVFDAEQTCVHLLALQTEMNFLAWFEQQEELHAYAEHPRYGTDPDMHYDRAAY